jgi:DNA-directed RNA polymerase subunit RPC12/RpoP
MQKLICPECKNDIDPIAASGGSELKKGVVIECPICGISLIVTGAGTDGKIEVEIADEGK